ncbi:MAG: leucine--tRNA ligase [Candidatus Levybacteria bacterium]|nr:leucine--tRNA ligase [Candidatus Levybacteria bacterium]
MKRNAEFNHRHVEKKWQKRWEKEKLYQPDIRRAKKPFYNLWMFPYPSAEGLHAGHVFASTGSDIYGRFMRMNGKTVFQPIGYDSFGIHTENFAMKIGEHPQQMINRTTANYKKQLQSLGHGYDWTRTVTTSDANYYKWTQWLFIQLFKKGLVYKKNAPVNFCPKDLTVLADEQVIDGKCERCDSIVEKKNLEQWFLKITDYADRLLVNIEKIDWPQTIKSAQKIWIGKSEGASVKFKTKDLDKSIEVFTTRPDTLFGATFLVLAPEHPIVKTINREEVKKYIEETKNKSEQERIAEGKEKTGVFSGLYAINPVNNQEIPIWIADYVLMGYGTGAIMAVPAHDQRDHDFAKKYDLKIIQVIKGGGQVLEKALEGTGSLINSREFNELNNKTAKIKIVEKLKEQNMAEMKTLYHLRDWLISRQRYWGPPIPLINCPKCGWQPVEEIDLPILLPEIKDWKPTGTGKSPLANVESFVKTTCPKCGGPAERETDVSDTFLDSAWYFLRYPTVNYETSTQVAFDPEITKQWLPVDLYFGGKEHAVLHLMYARFVTMVLYDLKLINFEEPFPKFFAHGLMIKDGAKMSKSKGNVINPDQYIEKFGADSFRLYLMFIGPMDGSPDYRDSGLEGMERFVRRILRLSQTKANPDEKVKKEILSRMHLTIKKVTEEITNFRYNTAIASIMEYVNTLEKYANKTEGNCEEWTDALKKLTLLISPFAPHISEEIWVEILKQSFSIHKQPWPNYNEKTLEKENITIVVQVNGKLRGQMEINRLDGKNKNTVEGLVMKDPKISRWIKDISIRRIFFLPNKLINFVPN